MIQSTVMDEFIPWSGLVRWLTGRQYFPSQAVEIDLGNISIGEAKRAADRLQAALGQAYEVEAFTDQFLAWLEVRHL